MNDCANLAERFQSCVARDRDSGLLRDDWLVSWPSGDQHRDTLPLADRFREYDDLRDYVRNWNDITRPAYRTFRDEDIRTSWEVTREMYRRFGIEPRHGVTLDKPTPLDEYNAEDYFFQTLYPRPDRYAFRHVLDFGAGFGRMAHYWARSEPGTVYLAVDAVERSYCVQHMYLSALAEFRELAYLDYIDQPETLALDRGIIHLPTWLMKGLPDNSIDLVLCCHVLPEISTELLRFAIEQFARVLVPGGTLYLRDHDKEHMPGHGCVDTDQLLENAGFALEFRPYLADGIDTWSIPRVWRKLDPAVPTRVMSQSGRDNWARLNPHR